MKSTWLITGLFSLSVMLLGVDYLVHGRYNNGFLVGAIFLQFIAIGLSMKEKRRVKNTKTTNKPESKYKTKYKNKR